MTQSLDCNRSRRQSLPLFRRYFTWSYGHGSTDCSVFHGLLLLKFTNKCPKAIY